MKLMQKKLIHSKYQNPYIFNIFMGICCVVARSLKYCKPDICCQLNIANTRKCIFLGEMEDREGKDIDVRFIENIPLIHRHYTQISWSNSLFHLT